MRNLNLLCALMFCSTISFAQEKLSVGILPFTYASNSVNSQDAYSISDIVVNGFVETKRFNVVDRTKMNELNKEKELQKSESFMDGQALVDQGKNLGAQFLVSGHISNVAKNQEWKTRTKLDGTTENYESFTASITFSCKIIDVETGQIVNSETFTNDGSGFLGLNGATSLDDAFRKGLSNLKSSIDSWVGKNFPLEIPFVEILEKDKKGNPSIVLIAAGSDFGIMKGEKLKIMEVSEIIVNGITKTRKKEIGEVKVSKVDDGSFSTCSVSSGAVELLTALNESKKIIIQTVK
jgi:hypothetical protein